MLYMRVNILFYAFYSRVSIFLCILIFFSFSFLPLPDRTFPVGSTHNAVVVFKHPSHKPAFSMKPSLLAQVPHWSPLPPCLHLCCDCHGQDLVLSTAPYPSPSIAPLSCVSLSLLYLTVSLRLFCLSCLARRPHSHHCLPPSMLSMLGTPQLELFAASSPLESLSRSCMASWVSSPRLCSPQTTQPP